MAFILGNNRVYKWRRKAMPWHPPMGASPQLACFCQHSHHGPDPQSHHWSHLFLHLSHLDIYLIVYSFFGLSAFSTLPFLSLTVLSFRLLSLMLGWVNNLQFIPLLLKVLPWLLINGPEVLSCPSQSQSPSWHLSVHRTKYSFSARCSSGPTLPSQPLNGLLLPHQQSWILPNLALQRLENLPARSVSISTPAVPMACSPCFNCYPLQQFHLGIKQLAELPGPEWSLPLNIIGASICTFCSKAMWDLFSL